MNYITGVRLEELPGEGSYLRTLPMVQYLSRVERLTFRKPVTFFVGENGTGKSTLLEGIAVAMGFNPEGGSKNYSFSTFDWHSELHRALRVVRGTRAPGWGYFLRAESFYNVATKELDYADIRHPSQRQMALLAVIHRCVRENAQFIIATHSPILMACPDSEVLEFTDNGIRATDYRQTEHYLVARRFLEDPERMLRYLLGEEEDNT